MVDVSRPTSTERSRESAPGTRDKEQSFLGRFQTGRRLASLGYGILSVSLLVAVWEAAYFLGLINPMLMPPPHVFLQEIANQDNFFSLSAGGEGRVGGNFIALPAIFGSVTRVLTGLTLGFLVSLVVGVVVSLSPLLMNLTLPVVRLLAPISPIAWLPIAIMFFGLGNGAAVFVVFVGVFFIMTLATVNNIRTVDPVYVQVAKTTGAGRWQTMRHVILPAVLPSLFLVLRLNFFAAWMIVLAAEMVGIKNGLGSMVMVGRSMFNADLIFLGMALIGITGYLVDLGFRTFQKRVLWWQTEGGI